MDEQLNHDFFVARERELERMSEILSHSHLILSGEGGIGKTTLLKQFKSRNPLKYENIIYWNGYELELDETLLVPLLISDVRSVSTLVIVDGFETIQSESLKEKIEILMREGRKRGFRVILATRGFINEKVFYQNSSELRLKGFDLAETSRLIDLFFTNQPIDHNRLSEIKDSFRIFMGNPLSIVIGLNFLESADISLSEIHKALTNGLNYRNQELITVLEKPEIILEEPPKIITDVCFANKRILDRINRNPQAVYHLSPRQFEIMVAEIFEEKGYHVQLTKQTRDGGKDLIILDRGEVGNFLIYAECKKYAPDRPVGVSVISDLFGRINSDRATAGVVVTSSYFSPDAITFTEKIKHQMKLVDFLQLSPMIKKSV